MEEQPPNYRHEFVRSPHHAWLGLVTLGLGFASGQLLGLILGTTAYALGWIYLPDLAFFRGWVDRRRDQARHAAALAQITEFIKHRDLLLNALTPSRRDRYTALAAVCRDIERASGDNPLGFDDPATDPRLRKLDELMWTYLRLLTIEESLERFLETERREDVPRLVQEAEQEATRLTAEIETLKPQGDSYALDSKQRLLSSRAERLDVLHKRLQRIEQAQQNLSLVVSEQERLDQQVKLIRADAVAAKNTDALTARIDASVEHLDQTNKWLAEMDEFKDIVGDLPATELRIGYDAPSSPPPLATAETPTATPVARTRVAAASRAPKS